MKMSNNSTKYEVLIKQYLRSILEISEGQWNNGYDLMFTVQDELYR